MSMISDLHELESEASKIEPILSACSAVYKSGHLSASDFAGIFILSYLGLRRPKSWSNGRFKNSVSLSYHHDVAFINHLPLSTEVSSIPGLLNILDREYVAKRMNCGVDDTDDSQRFSGITVLSIFDNLQLSRIKKNADNYVNRCLVCWAYNRRPCCLMFRIPTPLEVLQQQSEGSRVITMFLTKEQLGTRHVSMLYYMEGMQNHFKDSFEFLLHDMKHMENFVDTDTHDEQVGFFKCILRLSKYYLHQIDDQSDICKNSRVLSKNPAQDDLSAASCTAIFAANCADKCNLDTGSRSPWVCANYGDNQSNLTEKPNDLMENIAGLSIETELSSTYPKTKKCSSFPLKKFFTDLCGYDNQLWRELEYVISDMNCHVTHLMQYLLAKMLVATERLIHLPAIPHRMECPQENTMTESIPSFNCSPHGGDDSDRHEELLSHLQLSSIERRDNATLPLPAADTLYNDIDHNPNPNPRSSLLVKEALLSRWILLLGIFGIHSTTVSDDDDKNFINLEDMKEIIGHEIVHIPLVKSEVQSHLRCDLKLMSASDPYSAAVGMVNTAFKERGPLTASEGAALRDFFRKEAKS